MVGLDERMLFASNQRLLVSFEIPFLWNTVEKFRIGTASLLSIPTSDLSAQPPPCQRRPRAGIPGGTSIYVFVACR